ncbi:MAG: HIT family protein [Nitrosomonadales bacterium]|jgi:diadenosine tetraphosphate (Ap4A) HIT family hydrolase
MSVDSCALCQDSSYPILWNNTQFRIILVNDQGLKGYCRLETIKHIKEISDLSETDFSQLFNILKIVEKALILVFRPEKINLASLGNQTPHLHWHIIPRFLNDSFYPNSIWGKKNRNFNQMTTKEEISKVTDYLNHHLNF